MHCKIWQKRSHNLFNDVGISLRWCQVSSLVGTAGSTSKYYFPLRIPRCTTAHIIPIRWELLACFSASAFHAITVLWRGCKATNLDVFLGIYSDAKNAKKKKYIVKGIITMILSASKLHGHLSCHIDWKALRKKVLNNLYFLQKSLWPWIH